MWLFLHLEPDSYCWDRPDSGHAYSKTQPFNVRGKKTHKKQPQQQKQEKKPVNTNF